MCYPELAEGPIILTRILFFGILSPCELRENMPFLQAFFPFHTRTLKIWKVRKRAYARFGYIFLVIPAEEPESHFSYIRNERTAQFTERIYLYSRFC